MSGLNFLHFSGKTRECRNWPKCGDSSLLIVYMLCFLGAWTVKNQQFAPVARDSPHKNLLLSMNSRGIPNTSDEDGLIGAHKTPNKAKSGFIQAPAFIKKEIRRVGEQTSPRWHAQSDTQEWDEGGGLGSGSSSIRRFRFSDG